MAAEPSEHGFFAFAALGLLFALATPDRLLTALIVLGSSIDIERLQQQTPDRHEQWIYVIEKAPETCS